MSKAAPRNKHQKAAHRWGERKISRQQVDQLLELARSADADERLGAAQLLCPCHVRGCIPAVVETIDRLLEDADPRVRYAAWHTFEDGGVPDDQARLARLEALYARETDPKVRRFVAWFFGPTMQARQRAELQRMRLAGRPLPIERGKCDFCSARDLPVTRDYETMIPDGQWPRPALICERCVAKA